MNERLILECQGLTRTFHEGPADVSVLKGVDLKIAAGEQVAIIGTSGSGKSTLLHLLGGLDEPSSGTVLVDGEDIIAMKPGPRDRYRNSKLGFVYQFHHLLPEFTALENVSMPLMIRRLPEEEIISMATEMLQRVGLEHRISHKPGELSGGERQRTALARAMITKPLCILADEPTGNLDRQTAESVYKLMLELNEENRTSFVIVTHDHGLAERMSRTCVLEDGILRDD